MAAISRNGLMSTMDDATGNATVAPVHDVLAALGHVQVHSGMMQTVMVQRSFWMHESKHFNNDLAAERFSASVKPPFC
jgi:hypothetical protein